MTEHIEDIPISTIIRDDTYQVRYKLDERTIYKYIEAIKSGATMPAVDIAIVDGKPILLDGWHRVAAYEQLDIRSIKAMIVKASKKEALWLSAKANLSHGLALKPSEYREVFRAYVRSGNHFNKHGGYKSYRNMGKDLGKNHNTISNWMHKDFRKIARAIGNGHVLKGNGGLPEFDPVPALEAKAMSGIGEVTSAFSSSDDPYLRGMIIDEIGALLNQMKSAENWKPCDF
jgi:hypothetical protein